MALLQVPVVKAKGQTIEIDTDALPEDVYAEAILQGLKVLINRGASKITSAAYETEDDLKVAALAKAQEQIELCKTSKIKFTGQKKAAGASGAVMVEARRLAKAMVKDEMKRAGIKISHVEASEITKAANMLIQEDSTIVEKAKANLEERAKAPVKIDVKALVKTSPELVAKAEARKAKEKAEKPLSAKQAGMVAKQAKGQKNRPQATA
jgi:hypothetical protein